MATHTIENSFLKITVSESGAELHSVFHKEKNIELLWQADKSVWGRHAPVLFPIVGRLFNDSYIYKDKTYKMSQHGFARDLDFDLLLSGDNQLTFLLTENEQTLEKYPFAFNLYITYTLTDKKLQITYEVQNTNEEELFFSIGGHPAFNTPCFENTKYEEYQIEFNKDRYEMYPLKGNFQSGTTQKLELSNKTLSLQKELFQNDALIFKNNELSKVTLKHNSKGNILNFETDMPNFGIWSPKNTDKFVCLEPWCGIADYEKQTTLQEKEGIICLLPSQIHKSKYSIEI
ncbi:MAG: aldose 1-epimerase family protein [Cytophagales bacterium]